MVPVWNCAEHKRLAAEHLKAIADWKKKFDDTDAWQKALEAEAEVHEHCRQHGCRSLSDVAQGSQT